MGLWGSKVEDEVLASKLKKRQSSLTEEENLEQQALIRRKNSLAQVLHRGWDAWARSLCCRHCHTN